MSDLLALVKRYGQAIEDSCNPAKSHAVRVASHELAGQLLDLIEARIKVLEGR